jgi:WD40 repeat protein
LLTNAIANVGPISVALYVTSNFQNYKSGVFIDTTCPNSVNHAVTLVGYGTLNGQDHYILKNSWGTNWGDQGYMLFARNNNNMCNIAIATFYPVVLKDSNSTTLPITTTSTTSTTFTTSTTSLSTTTYTPSSTTTTSSSTTTSGNQPTKLMYPYGPSSGDTLLPKNDDGSYGPIKIGLKFTFFNKVYSSIFVNSNGFISFLSAISKNFPIQKYPMTTPLISPFWSDISTLVGGQIYFRESFCSCDLNQAKTEIAEIYSTTFNPTRLYITTWDQVAAYDGSSSQNNTFQLVIATDGKLSFLIYNFGSMTWPNNQFSMDAFFGYNAGDNVNFYSNPNSFTNNIISVSSQSNVNIPGKWIFFVSPVNPTTIPTRTPTKTQTTIKTTTTTKSNSPFIGSVLYTLTGHTNVVYVFANLPNGNLASGSRDNTVKIWNPNTGSLIYTLAGHTNAIFSLVVLPNGNLASGSWDNTVKIWNPNTGSLINTLIGHTDLVYSIAALPNGNLASCSWDTTVKIWNPNTGSLIFNLTNHTSVVRILALLPNGNLASGSWDNTVKIWNPNNGLLIYTLTGQTSGIWSMIVLPNGFLASGSFDGNLIIWNPYNGSLVSTLVGHTNNVFAFSILSNGYLASCSDDLTVRIWNPNNGALLYTLTGHQDQIFSLATLTNGYLASGSEDNTIKIWDPNTGLLKLTLTGHSSYIYKLIVLPNGNLASGSHDATIKIWN